MLTEAEKAYFMDMESLFNSSGWSRLVTGWKAEQEQIVESALWLTEEQRREAKERWQLLAELLRLPTTVDEQKTALTTPDEDNLE